EAGAAGGGQGDEAAAGDEAVTRGSGRRECEGAQEFVEHRARLELGQRGPGAASAPAAEGHPGSRRWAGGEEAIDLPAGRLLVDVGSPGQEEAARGRRGRTREWPAGGVHA